MGVTLHSTHLLDQAFAAAYARTSAPGAEYGFAAPAVGDPSPGTVSGWLAGDDPQAAVTRLDALRRAGSRFRFLFAERYFAPAIEAHRLFTGGHLGTRIHFLAKVQAHPARLTRPLGAEPHAWLAEPVLNRLPLMVWMMGPVADARVVTSERGAARAAVVMLRHRTPGRLSILEWSVTPAGSPDALDDRFECTGSDGFLRVNGVWGASRLPRLELHRGALESVKRDLDRDFAQVFARAAERLGHERDAELTAHYLEACRLILEK
jgi:predicted dehydrogenase